MVLWGPLKSGNSTTALLYFSSSSFTIVEGQETMKEHPKAAEVRLRIRRAFKRAEQEQLACRARFLCCGGCAVNDFWTKRKTEHAGKVGFAYYHRQDADLLREKGYTFIGFGGFTASPVEVMRTLKKLLVKAGLAVEWDGTAGQRPCVKLAEPR